MPREGMYVGPPGDGFGAGEHEYRVRIFAVVEIISQPVHALSPEEALKRVDKIVPYDMLLRNITPGPFVDKVAYADRIVEVQVDEASSSHEEIHATVATWQEEELKEVLKRDSR